MTHCIICKREDSFKFECYNGRFFSSSSSFIDCWIYLSICSAENLPHRKSELSIAFVFLGYVFFHLVLQVYSINAYVLHPHEYECGADFHHFKCIRNHHIFCLFEFGSTSVHYFPWNMQFHCFFLSRLSFDVAYVCIKMVGFYFSFGQDHSLWSGMHSGCETTIFLPSSVSYSWLSPLNKNVLGLFFGWDKLFVYVSQM